MPMEELRGSLCKYRNENTLLSHNAQIGVRKSVATALEGGVYGAVYLFSVDFEGSVNGLCGPRLLDENFPAA